MGICHNSAGKLAYTMKTDIGVFSVSDGENRIIRHYPFFRNNARLNVGYTCGEDIPVFNSFIRAVAYMKRNAADLM